MKLKALLSACVIFLLPFSTNAQDLASHLDANELMLGIRMRELSEMKKEWKGDSRPRTSFGLVVGDVYKGSPTDQLNPLDIILTIDGKPMKALDDYEAVHKQLKPNTQYEFTVLRYIRGRSGGAWRKGNFEITPITLGEFSLSAMVPKRDEIRRITYYTNKYVPEVNEATNVGVYIAHKDGSAPTPLLRFQYVGEDWLFVNKYTIRIGEKVFELKPSEVERDNSARKVWEWYDSPVTGETAKLVEALSHVKKEKVIVRFGGERAFDYTLTEQDIDCIKMGLIAMKTLKK